LFFNVQEGKIRNSHTLITCDHSKLLKFIVKITLLPLRNKCTDKIHLTCCL